MLTEPTLNKLRALRLDAFDKPGRDDIDPGKAAAVEIMKVVQTARCAGASIA